MRAVGTHITDVNASSHSCHHLFLQDETTMESQLEARVTDAWAAQQQSQKKQWERRVGPVKNTIHGSDFSFIRMEKIHPSVSGTLPFLFTQSRPTLSNTMDCSPPGSCVHGISQASILESVAISFSRGSSLQGSKLGLLHCRQILFHCPLGKPQWFSKQETPNVL